MSQDALTSELKERLWDLKRWCRHDRYDHDRTDHQMVADFHCATIDMVEMALRSLAPPSAIAPSEDYITVARAQAFVENQPIYNAALASAGAIATALKKNGVRLCDCGSAPQGICCCSAGADKNSGGQS